VACQKKLWYQGDVLKFRSILGLLALGGCGISPQEYNIKVTDLERCQAELQQTQTQLSSARQQVRDQSEEVRRRDDEILDLRSQSDKLTRNLSATQREMDDLRRAHAQAEQRSELYRTLVSRLKDMISSGTLAVEIRKGKMIVKLGDQILFDPGQATLKTEGKVALRQVAQVLKEIPDRDFLVAGHTDNRPIKASPFASNWDLSTARAVTVVRFLQGEGVDPRHLAAAGYSEFDAVEDNGDPDKRALNRRIEVVVMPRIDELPAIDVSEPAAATSAPPPAPPAAATPPAPAPPTR
jgi:chemotaxis protein MotB